MPNMLTKLRQWLTPSYTFALFIPALNNNKQEPGIVAIERNGEMIRDINDWPEFWMTVVEAGCQAYIASTNRGAAAPIAASLVESYDDGGPTMSCIQVAKGCTVIVLDERNGTAVMYEAERYGQPIGMEIDWGEAHRRYCERIQSGDYNRLRPKVTGTNTRKFSKQTR